MDQEEIRYVARRYKPGRFNADKGWRRLGIAPSFRLRRLRVAAAVAGAVVLSATAAFVFHRYNNVGVQEAAVPVQETVAPELVVRVIDFEDTPLPVVVGRINEVYGVEVMNMPEDAGEYTLSLHYEGNAADLVETINDILGTQMYVAK